MGHRAWPAAAAGSLLAALLLVASSGCAHIIGGTVDYVFSAGGVVKDAAGAALSDVTVTLEVGEGVYEATSRVQTKSTITRSDGGFRFQYISHLRNVSYTLRFAKPGYAAHSIRGSSPPSKDVSVVLEEANNDGRAGN